MNRTAEEPKNTKPAKPELASAPEIKPASRPRNMGLEAYIKGMVVRG
jgi:hypothetical protein